jgi:hypothetical protein
LTTIAWASWVRAARKTWLPLRVLPERYLLALSALPGAMENSIKPLPVG